jgi:hypothetical protein
MRTEVTAIKFLHCSSSKVRIRVLRARQITVDTRAILVHLQRLLQRMPSRLPDLSGRQRLATTHCAEQHARQRVGIQLVHTDCCAYGPCRRLHTRYWIDPDERVEWCGWSRSRRNRAE